MLAPESEEGVHPSSFADARDSSGCPRRASRALSATFPPMAIEVDRVIAALVRECEGQGRILQGVWLFGSCARGEAGPDSDVDLAILCDPPLGLDVAVLGDRVSRSLDAEVDVIDLATTSATLGWEIVTSGRLVVERDALGVEAFLRATRYRAEDEARRNRMVILAQAPRIGATRG